MIAPQAEDEGKDLLITFRCPRCGYRTYIVKTTPKEGFVRRRRVCSNDGCGHRFATHELMLSETRDS